jgi:hypothetical protein
MSISTSFSVSDTPAIEKLEATIVALDASTKDQTKTMVKLTLAIAVMTFIMMVCVGVQVWSLLD